MASSSSYLRDEVYYFADGNVTILVSKTLFKVHRFILARDSSTFVDLFALDNCASVDSESDSRILEREGTTDDNPIHLQGDTVDEFRDLLWSLSALPSETATTMSAEEDLIRLSNIVRMTHKYHYITTEAWALRTLLVGFSSQPTSMPTSILVQITEVAVLCEDKSLVDAVRLRWKSLVSERKNLAIAINLMGRLGIREVEGLAYYGMLLEGRESWESDPNLTRDQRIRFLSGFYNLIKAYEVLMNTPPVFTHHPQCSEDGCNYNWAILWEHIIRFSVGVLSQTILDLIGGLRNAVSMMQDICKGSYPDGMGEFDLDWPACHDGALQATMRVLMETEENMMDFFVDVE